MKTYTVLYAQDVPHYGLARVEAADDEAVIDAARKVHADGHTDFRDPDWSGAILQRIVHIEDADGNIIAQDIALDNYFLSHGKNQRRLFDTAADMLAALEAQEIAEHDPEATRRKDYFDHARALRKAAITRARRRA